MVKHKYVSIERVNLALAGARIVSVGRGVIV